MFLNEIIDYYSTGQSIIFYNHSGRENEDTFFNRFRAFTQSEDLCTSHFFGLKFAC